MGDPNESLKIFYKLI